MGKTLPVPQTNILMYQTEDGDTKINVFLDGQTVWLSQKLIAELYQKDIRTINEHIKNIFSEGELDPDSTIRKFRIVQMEGQRKVTREIEHYNLETILAVGYRVRSHRGTQFRRWATTQLNELLVKGYVLDDERLKEGRHLGTDYFDELLERIRDIRASEKRFYQKVRDIYATSVDYDPHTETSQSFFATVQNKMHFAVTGHTAAELINERADASKPNMGLQTWKSNKVRKGDVTVAKNYLKEDELRELNRIVTMYLDYAEDQARNQRPMTMADWAARLDAFLQFNERELLLDAGKVSAELAKAKAEEEYDRFHTARIAAENQQAEEEFDHLVERMENEDKE